MLSDDERREIEDALTHYAVRQSGATTAMKIVQRHRGWLSDDALDDVAQELGMTVHELDELCTFYNTLFRKPVGRHVILVCDSFACWSLGYEEVRQYLVERLGIEMGGTTPDGRFTLLPIVCLGACDVGPAMMIDQRLFGDLTTERIDAALEEFS